MRIGILGNCQSIGIAACVEAFVPECDVIPVVVSMDHVNIAERFDELVQAMAGCDRVLVQALDGRHNHMTPLFEAVRAAARRSTIAWPVVFFRGFHPDCVHVMDGNRALDGIMAGLHSALLAAAWCEGLTVRRASHLLNAFSYAALGYYDTHAQECLILGTEGERLGYDLADFLRPDAAPFMHTVNHPKIALLGEISRQALDLGEIGRRRDIVFPHDFLADGPIWPLYPEIGRRLGWASAESANWSEDAVDAFALRAYQSLDKIAEAGLARCVHDGQSPAQLSIVRARQFIRTHVTR